MDKKESLVDTETVLCLGVLIGFLAAISETGFVGFLILIIIGGILMISDVGT